MWVLPLQRKIEPKEEAAGGDEEKAASGAEEEEERGSAVRGRPGRKPGVGRGKRRKVSRGSHETRGSI